MATANPRQQDPEDEKPDRPVRPKLAHLRSFVYLARLGSMTAAAEELGMSQPTMSDHIDQLERGFEDKLFTRGPTGVNLTASGAALCRTIEHSVNQLDNLTFRSLGRPLILGGPPDLLRERVLPTLAPLLSPDDIRIQIQPGIAEELLEHLRHRTIDLFIATRRLNPLDIKVTYHRLFQEEYVLVGNASWRKRIPPRASEEEAVRVLAEAPFLAFDVDLPLIRDHPLIAEHEAAIFGARPLARVSLIMPNFGALRNAAIAGGGVTVVPRYVAEGAIKAKQLYELYEPQDRHFNQIYLAHRDEPQNEAVQRIIDELRRSAPHWETRRAKASAAAEHAQQSRTASAKSPFYEQRDGK
jgi:DNA-binding transcriptional LysR family regulator